MIAARTSTVFRSSIPARFRQSSRSKRRTHALLAAMCPDQVQDMLSPMMDHLFLAYERVVMPCHNMNCGDVVHRRLVTSPPKEVLLRSFSAHVESRCDHHSYHVTSQLELGKSIASNPLANSLTFLTMHDAWIFTISTMLPCSTLDPVLRLEQRGITPQGIVLVSGVIAYLFAKPGMSSLAMG